MIPAIHFCIALNFKDALILGIAIPFEKLLFSNHLNVTVIKFNQIEQLQMYMN
jgi:hypothetical protein